MNRAELVAALVQRAALKKADATRAVDALFGTNGIIAAELRRGARVQITGFGSFHPRSRGAREGRDPRTGKTIQIRAAVVPLFRAGAALKAALNRKR
ncbi:MAG TPA: HU family DNA-binding protein [Gemmatimonadales bacterium]|nr:HU family DNA-binding protein [Gemmatimonadales bacterium]